MNDMMMMMMMGDENSGSKISLACNDSVLSLS
jgi:hypothetical protein